MLQYPALYKGKLIKRYKRFFADISNDSAVITAHNPNTGSMKSLLHEGNSVYYSISENKNRKLPFTLELIKVGEEWVVSNTIMVNKIVERAFIDHELSDITKSTDIKREFKFLDSRIDFFVNDEKPTLVEVKSVTFFDDDSCYFPDAVTTRGKKHLITLVESIKHGYRPVLLYVCMVKRNKFACADFIDPDYSDTLHWAIKNGLEVFLYNCEFDEGSSQCKLVRSKAIL